MEGLKAVKGLKIIVLELSDRWFTGDVKQRRYAVDDDREGLDFKSKARVDGGDPHRFKLGCESYILRFMQLNQDFTGALVDAGGPYLKAWAVS